MKLFKARFESWRFDFTAYGETKEKAIDALKKGLDHHAKQYDIEPDWWKQYEGDIFTVEIALGSCYRDNEKIHQYK